MAQFKRILIPMDVDRNADAVVGYAALMAHGFGSAVDLAHIFETTGYDGPDLLELGPDGRFGDPNHITHWWSAQKMVNILTALHGQGVTQARGRMLHGVISETVMDLVKQEKYDLVIMASSGHHGLERFVFGNITEEIVRDCGCPVLAVPVHTPPSH